MDVGIAWRWPRAGAGEQVGGGCRCSDEGCRNLEEEGEGIFKGKAPDLLMAGKRSQGRGGTGDEPRVSGLCNWQAVIPFREVKAGEKQG